MLKRAITYESYDGEKVTEDFYFHISRADVAKMELSKFSAGGLKASLDKMMQDQNGSAIVEELDKIILMAVGRKSEDGKRFVKNDEIRSDFESSPAYEVIFMELVTDAGKAAAFIAACVPGDPEEMMQAMREDENLKNVFDTPEPDDPGVERKQPPPQDPTALDGRETAQLAQPAVTNTPRVLTLVEATEMGRDELQQLLATGQAVIGSD